MRDPISSLNTVMSVLEAELARPERERNPCVVASCALFIAVCTRPAQRQQELIDRRFPSN